MNRHSAWESDRDMKEKLGKKVVLIFFWISFPLTLCLCGLFFVNFIPLGFVDFPCFVRVENGYLVDGGYSAIEITEQTDALIFVTIGMANTNGAGCLARSVRDGETIRAGQYGIKVDGDQIVIDEEVRVPIGESVDLEAKRYGLNPWRITVDYLALKNEGFIQGSVDSDGNRTEYSRQVLVAIGSGGDRLKLNPITALIFAGLLLSTAITGIYLLISSIARWRRKAITKKEA